MPCQSPAIPSSSLSLGYFATPLTLDIVPLTCIFIGFESATQRSHRSQPCFLVRFPFFYNAKKFLLGRLRNLAYPPAVARVTPVYPPPRYAPSRVLLVGRDLGSIPLISSFLNSRRGLTISATVVTCILKSHPYSPVSRRNTAVYTPVPYCLKILR